MSDSYKTAWSFAGNVAHVMWLGKFSDYNLVRLYFPGGGGVYFVLTAMAAPMKSFNSGTPLV